MKGYRDYSVAFARTLIPKIPPPLRATRKGRKGNPWNTTPQRKNDLLKKYHAQVVARADHPPATRSDHAARCIYVALAVSRTQPPAARGTAAPTRSRRFPARFRANRKCQKRPIPFPNMLTTLVRLIPCQTTTYGAQPGPAPSCTALADTAPETHLKPI